jgi:hypothetical protein
VRERLLGLPGVRSVSMAQNPLMTGSVWERTVRVEGYTPGEDENVNPRVNGVGPGFFTTLGMPLVAGREIDERDAAGSPRVAVVSEAFARRYFAGRDPVGRRIGWGRDRPGELPIEIVGVVRDARTESLHDDPELFGAFGLLATLLAAVGLYGVMSYAVSRRTREFGLRIALGADRRRILGLVLGEIVALAGVGMAIGLPGGWGLGRLVESRLFGLEAFDPPTLLLAVAVLATAALLAGALPTWRALRVEPAAALRYE